MKHRRILMTADLQIDEDVAHSLPGKSPGMTRRLEDMLECWAWVLCQAQKNKCTLIAILGDIFDNRSAVTLPCLHAFAEMLLMAKRMAIGVMACSGNHDSHNRDGSITSITPYQGLADIITKPQLYDGMAVVPWVDGRDYAKSLKPFRGKCDVLLSHVLITGAIAHAKGIDGEVFKGFARVFLGDVHIPTDVYVGSWMQLDYRDAWGTRGVVVYDREKKSRTYIENTVSPQYYLVDQSLHAVDIVLAKARSIDHVWCTAPVSPEEFEELRSRVATIEAPPNITQEARVRSGIAVTMSDGKLLKRYLKSVDLYSRRRLREGVKLLMH